MEFEHLMLDLETMGTDSYSSIVSIAAVEFDINTGKTGNEFYSNVCLQSCLDSGLHVSGDTVMWWMSQSDEARNGLLDERHKLDVVLKAFSIFCDRRYYVWGNSASFDCGILKNAYEKLKMPVPWDFWNERCVRTLSILKPDIKRNFKNIGTPHNALDDCKFQIGYCSKIWASINGQ